MGVNWLHLPIFLLLDIFILNWIHKIFWWKEACQYLFNDDFHIQSSPNVTEICKLKCWALCWIIGYWNLNVTTTYLLTTLVLLPFPPIFWTFSSHSAKELNTELSMTCSSPGPVSPLCLMSQSDWEHVLQRYIFVTFVKSEAIIGLLVRMQLHHHQNKMSVHQEVIWKYGSDWWFWSQFEAQKLLFSLSNFVFKNILFSSLNLILSDEKWSNECSHFCWRHLGSETQEEGAPREIPLIQISHFSTY